MSENESKVGANRFRLRNLVWPDLTQIEVSDQDQALLPSAALGGFITSLCALAFFVVVGTVIYLALDAPTRYVFLGALSPGAIISSMGIVTMIRVFIRMASKRTERAA